MSYSFVGFFFWQNLKRKNQLTIAGLGWMYSVDWTKNPPPWVWIQWPTKWQPLDPSVSTSFFFSSPTSGVDKCEGIIERCPRWEQLLQHERHFHETFEQSQSDNLCLMKVVFVIDFKSVIGDYWSDVEFANLTNWNNLTSLSNADAYILFTSMQLHKQYC